jgi:hypothetical protein
LPFSLPANRDQAALTATQGKMFFGGGLDRANQMHSRVDVFDAASGTWTVFNLTQPRRLMAAGSYGSRVVFAGGFLGGNLHSNIVDVYDIDNDSVTHVEIPIEGTGPLNGVLVGDTKAIIYGRNTAAWRLDLITLDVVVVSAAPSNYAYGTSNGTHGFIVSVINPRLMTINLETLEITSVPQNHAVFQVTYSDNYVYLIGRTSVTIYATLRNETIRYNYRPLQILNSQTAVVIGRSIYLFAAGYVVINPFFPEYEIHHALPQNVQAVASAVANDIIVFGLINGGYLTLNTLYTLRRLPTDTLSTATYTIRDTMFFFGQPNISTYDFNARSLTIHPLEGENFASRTGAELKTKFSVVARRSNADIVAYLYDFNSRSMERVPLPSIRFNDVIGVGDVIAIRGLRDGESVHTINLFDSTTHSFKELRFPTIQIAAHKNNLAVLTRNSVILFDLATNTTIREISIPGRLPLGNILTTDDFIFVLGTNGITSAVSIFVVDLHRNVTTERVLTVRPMENVQMVVVGKYAVFTGGVTTQTQPLEVFDMVSLEWKFILLPRTLFTRSISLLAIDNRVFVGRSLTIDAVDVASGKAATLPFPVAELSKMVSVGSKLVVHSVAAASAVVTITMYEVTTGDWTSMTIPTLVTSLVEIVSNYIVVYIGQVLRANPFVIPLSTMLEGFDSRELFIGQTTNLAVTAAGPELTYRWYHDGQALPDSSSSVLLDNITMSSDGEYRVDVIDHCHLHIVHEARVTVHDKPAFNIPLRDSVTLCDGTEELIVDSEGVAVEYKWTIDGATVVDASESHLNLTINNIPCNTRALVCVIAFNPSGPSQSCAGVRMLELDSVIKGPLPTISPSTWFSESVAELRVEVLEEDCTSHTWIIDGVAGTKYEAQSSTLSVELSPAMARTQFYVRLKCGNSVIKSRTFSFEQVSALPVYGVVLIVVGLVTGVAVFVVVIFFLRKRLSQSQVKEVELSTLLSNAKTDSIKKESMPIINKTTWEWTPTEDFSYKSLESLPIIVDASQLKFSERGEPLEAEMNYNKELTLSSRSQKKLKKATILTERLITDMKIDIYAPKSPKYQVIVEPETLYLESGASYSVTVSVRMNMTTKCNVVLIVVLEQQKIYSAIEFKLSSKMSTWIDLEEIQMTGEFLGGGG